MGIVLNLVGRGGKRRVSDQLDRYPSNFEMTLKKFIFLIPILVLTISSCYHELMLEVSNNTKQDKQVRVTFSKKTYNTSWWKDTIIYVSNTQPWIETKINIANSAFNDSMLIGYLFTLPPNQCAILEKRWRQKLIPNQQIIINKTDTTIVSKNSKKITKRLVGENICIYKLTIND